MDPSRLLWSFVLCETVVACHGQSPRAAQSSAAGQTADTTLGTPVDDSLAQSAVRFTQSFYDWYRTIDDADQVAVQRRPEYFGPELLSALRNDYEAQHRSPGEIVGIDWDPFTASQDPCDPYEAGRTTRHGDTDIVSVSHQGCGGAKKGRPDLYAELRRYDGQWRFVDFRDTYDSVSAPASVLESLAELAKDRASRARRGRK